MTVTERGEYVDRVDALYKRGLPEDFQIRLLLSWDLEFLAECERYIDAACAAHPERAAALAAARADTPPTISKYSQGTVPR